MWFIFLMFLGGVINHHMLCCAPNKNGADIHNTCKLFEQIQHTLESFQMCLFQVYTNSLFIKFNITLTNCNMLNLIVRLGQMLTSSITNILIRLRHTLTSTFIQNLSTKFSLSIATDLSQIYLLQFHLTVTHQYTPNKFSRLSLVVQCLLYKAGN